MSERAMQNVTKVMENRRSRAYVRSLLVLTLFLGAWILFGFTVGALLGADSSKAIPVMRVMHMSQVHPSSVSNLIPVVRSYFSFDWVMAPSPQHTDVYFATVSGVTAGDKKRLSPSPWQSTNFCPRPSMEHATWEEGLQNSLSTVGVTSTKDVGNVEKQVLCDSEHEDIKLCGKDVNGLIQYPNSLGYYVCLLRRVPVPAIFENDGNTWSLGSSHSPFILVWFLLLNIIVISMYELLRWWYVVYKCDQMKEANRMRNSESIFGARAAMYMNLMILVSVVLFFLVILFRFLMPTLANFELGENTDDDTFMTGLHSRSLPNGSFLYGVGSFIVISIFCALRLSNVTLYRYGVGVSQEDMPAGMNMEQDQLAAEVVMENQEAKAYRELAELSEEAIVATSKEPVKTMETPETPMTPMAAGQPRQLNLSVSSFIGGKKIAIGACAVDKSQFTGPVMVAADDNTMVNALMRINDVHKLAQSVWSIAQVTMLPLWALCAMCFAQGFELDIDVQTVFLATFVLAVSDSYLDRLLNVTHVCHVLNPGMLMRIEYVIFATTVVVQGVLVALINFVSGWRYTSFEYDVTVRSQTLGDAENNVHTLNQWALVGFNTYFTLVAVLKLAKAYYRDWGGNSLKAKNYENGWWSHRSFDEFKLALLLLFIFLYCFAALQITLNTKNWFLSMNEVGTSLDAEDIEMLRWRADWTPTHSVHAH